jgi:hypothetical protein
MKIPRILAVFICAAGAVLALAIIKALVVSGLDTLPPGKVLVFAASTFGLIAALLDWALLRDRRKMVPVAEDSPKAPISGVDRAQFASTVVPGISKARIETPDNAIGRSKPKAAAAHEPDQPPQTKVPQTDSIVERGRLRPIVFREIFPPSATAGLSFYGGVPVGPAGLSWPRVRNKPGNAPLSFIMQWDCAKLAAQDETALLPRDGVLYLFCDLTWGDPFDFQFVHASDPVDGMQAIPIPPALPPIYGDEGAYQVPYCSPQIAKENQDIPRLLPKWPFTPIAFSYPGSPTGLFWNDSGAVAEALLLVQHPDGVPPVRRHNEHQEVPFGRPFAAFPHDHAAVRVVVSKVLDHLRHPSSWLLREASEHERTARFQAWRDEAAQLHASAATHRPAARVEQSLSDNIWQWMEGLQPVLQPGWTRIVEECINVSLGLGSEAAGTIPANLVAACAERHKLASAYLHDEYPDRSEPDELARWEARKAEGSLKEIRSLHAPCPNHIFGPPSFVQGHVEEYLEEWILLLELSSCEPVGLNLGEGVLQFMIRPADLRERRFDKVMLVASAY